MRTIAEQPHPFAQRFAYLTDFAVLQVAQPAMNEPRGSAGRTGAEVVLLDQQGAALSPSALARNRDAVNPASDHHDLEALAVERRSTFKVCSHGRGKPSLIWSFDLQFRRKSKFG